MLEQIVETLGENEVMIIASTNMLLMTSHTKEFVESTRKMINLLELRQIVKDYLNLILDEITIKE